MYQLTGRIDSTNAPQWEERIMSALPTDLDATELAYISSAGLRVLLKLKKIVGDVTIHNVSSEVYDIFDVTGFIELMNVKEAVCERNLTASETCSHLTNVDPI